VAYSGALSANTEALEKVENIIQQGADIRMLIDISGSMKKNDPSNLRIPAVNLLTELIPDGDKAGVWTFGQWVNNLIQHKVVDDAWRLSAKSQANKINSVALYTNIGAVLEKSSDDFYQSKKDFSNTHFILLTDGMVDIDRDPVKNAVERDRVLTNILKKFADKGAKIHAISLSKNADKSLMDKLAIQTGGQSAVAETPEDLTRIFLQALDQAVPSEQVPIEGNEFVIDSSIEEFTALIFRGDGTVPTEILSPDETRYQYSSHGDDVKWYQDQGYDLITVKRPLEGTWYIKADVQPSSRVTVVSNLQLQVSKLPVNFFAGENLDINVSFKEDGNLVTNADFLSLLTVDLELKTENNKTAKKSMSGKDKPPADGIYRDAITKLTKMGQYELTVLVDGKTFKRKNRQIINLVAPFDFEFSVVGEGDGANYRLVVSPLNDSISVKDTNVFAKVNAPDGSSLINALDLDEEKGRWVLSVGNDKGDGLYKIAVKVKATDSKGKKYKFKPKPFEAVFPIPVGEANKIISQNEPEEKPEEPAPEEEKIEEPEEQEPEAEPEQEEVPVEEEVEEEEGVDLVDEPDLMFWAMMAGIALGIIALIGGIFYFFKKKKVSEDVVEEILTDEDVAEINEEPAVDVPELNEELDFVEEAIEEDDDLSPVMEEPEEIAAEEIEEVESEMAESVELESEELDLSEDVPEIDEALDLSSDDLSEVASELEAADDPEPAPPVEDEEDIAADIAQAIQESSEEQEEELDQEVQDALDISEVEDEDDDDDDEEFNLEDFDIGDTDDLPSDEDKT